MNEVQATSEMLREFALHCREGFLAFDDQWRCLYCSPAFEKGFGLDKEKVAGQDLLTLLPFLRQMGEERFLQQTLAGRTCASREWLFHKSGSGQPAHYEADYFPRFSAEQPRHVIGGIIVVRDVTKEREALALNREIEERFRNMANHSPVMLWMAGTDSLCNFFNQTWLDFTGRPLSAEWGVGWADGVFAEDFQLCMDTYIAAFNERRPFEMEYRLRRHDGKYRWILDRGVPRYAPDGTFAGYIGSCVDITEHKQIETGLREAVSIREEFLSIASHELKTPLTSLNLQLGILTHVLQNDSDMNEVIKRIKAVSEVSRRQLGKLTELIEDLLDVSRVSAGRLALEPRSMDLVTLASEVIEKLQPQAKAAGIELSVHSDHAAVTGTWDRGRMDQVLSNLLTNAIKYAPGHPVAIHLSATDHGAHFEVRDHGPGIPDDQQAKIFEKFHRVSPRNASGAGHVGGLGLGLYIVKQIVEGHDGQISVESKPGLGSCFRVDLPLERHY